jgi:hypothetical protein
MLKLTRRAALSLIAAAAARRALAQAAPPTDVPFIESFGPVGSADDTATFNVALRSGKPFRLHDRSYSLAGPLTNAGAPVSMHGVPGATRLVCKGLDTGNWFTLETKAATAIDGIIWDGSGAHTGKGVGMVTISGSPTAFALRRCAFVNAANPAALLVIMDQDGADMPLAAFEDIEASGNAGSGIWIEHGVNLSMTGLRLHDNKGSGLRAMRFNNRAGGPIRRIIVRDSIATRNGEAGFALGTYNQAPGGSPPVLGPDLPDVVDTLLSNLSASDNGGYGVVAQGQNLHVIGCRTSRNGPNGGIVANSLHSTIEACEVTDERAFGIDTGGSREVTLLRNTVINIDGAGLNPGGSVRVTGKDNRIVGCTGPAISLWNTEFGGGGWLAGHTEHCRFTNTVIDLSRMGNHFAVEVHDGPEDIVFDGIDFFSKPAAGHPAWGPERAMFAAARTIRVTNARFNGATQLPGHVEAGILTFPDIAGTVVLPAAPAALTAIRTNSAAMVGTGIGWISVSDPGAGYDPARSTAVLEGDGNPGSVGKVIPNIWTGGGGQLSGFRLERTGSGFTHASVRMSGPGSGARIAVQVGIPIPAERMLRLVFPAGGTLGGRLPAMTVPRNGTVVLKEASGAWVLAGGG